MSSMPQESSFFVAISRDHVHDNRVVANGENVTHVLSRRAPGCTSGILPLVCVDVNNVQVSTLVDSGSNVSFVTRQLVRDWVCMSVLHRWRLLPLLVWRKDVHQL